MLINDLFSNHESYLHACIMSVQYVYSVLFFFSN